MRWFRWILMAGLLVASGLVVSEPRAQGENDVPSPDSWTETDWAKCFSPRLPDLPFEEDDLKIELLVSTESELALGRGTLISTLNDRPVKEPITIKAGDQVTVGAGNRLIMLKGSAQVRVNEIFDFLLFTEDSEQVELEVDGDSTASLSVKDNGAEIKLSPEDETARLQAQTNVDFGNDLRPVPLARLPRVWPMITGEDQALGLTYGAFRPAGLTMRVGRIRTNLEAVGIRACVIRGESMPEDGVTKDVVALSQEEGQPTVIDVELPTEAISFRSPKPIQKVTLAIASDDGSLVRYGSTWYVTPVWAIGAATLTTVIGLGAILAWLGASSKRRLKPFASLFIGHDGRASISLLQMTMWTLIVVWSLVYVFFRSWELLALTPQVMGLLGVAGVSTVSARLIASSRRPFDVVDGKVRQGEEKQRGSEKISFLQLFQNKDGTFELANLQLFIFSLLIGAYVLFRVVKDGAFPILDDNFLLLMGISNGVYLANKLSGPSAYTKLDALKSEANVIAEQIKDIKEVEPELVGKIEDCQKRVAECEDENMKVMIEQRLEELKEKYRAVTKLEKQRNDLLAEYRKAYQQLAQ